MSPVKVRDAIIKLNAKYIKSFEVNASFVIYLFKLDMDFISTINGNKPII
jgi:hypothetical protein